MHISAIQPKDLATHFTRMPHRVPSLMTANKFIYCGGSLWPLVGYLT